MDVIILQERFKPYDWFHWMWIGITILLSFMLSFLVARKHKELYDKIVLGVLGGVLLIIEVLKQIFFLKANNGVYNYNLIPFQLCSLPMYVWIPIVIMKKCSFRDALMKFLATYTFLGGFLVYVYPETCISTPYLIIAIHTMLWHAILIIIGIYLVVSQGYGKSFKKEILPSTFVFLFFVAVTISANEITNACGGSINLFFLSFKFGCQGLPIDAYIIYKGNGDVVRWIIYLISYIIGFFGLTSLEYLVIKLIRYIHKQHQNKKGDTSN